MLTTHVLAPAAALTPAPPMVKVPVPGTPVMVGAPPQLLSMLAGVAITTPAGNASLNVRFVRAGAPAGFAIVNVSVEDTPAPAGVGANALVSEARPWTVRLRRHAIGHACGGTDVGGGVGIRP